MESKEHLKNLDWDSAIAAATTEIEKAKNSPPPPPPPEAYLTRGIARCFKDGKNGKYDEAIEDLSRALSLVEANDSAKDTGSAEDTDTKEKALSAKEARYYRAYAYYITAYLQMRNGRAYDMTINGEATEYFLQHIYDEEGYDALQTALRAVEAHLAYQENIQTLDNIREIYNRFRNMQG
jgi:tetratricopeptide (TPR) repeat protein